MDFIDTVGLLDCYVGLVMAFITGHKNAYMGKKIDKKRFVYALGQYRAQKMSLVDFGKYVGLSPITAQKRISEYLMYGDLPAYLWERE